MTPSRRIAEDAAREAFEIYRTIMFESAKQSLPSWDTLRADVKALWIRCAAKVVQ